MGRKNKYPSGTVILNVSIEKEVLDAIDKRVAEINKVNRTNMNRSEFVTNILRDFAFSESEHCRMMQKRASQELYYWQSMKEAAEVKKE